MSEVGDALLEAAGVVNERGWCQDTVEDSQGRVCALGAINVVVMGNAHGQTVSELGMSMRYALMAVLGQPGTYCGIATHNNAAGRTQAEIIEWFEKAAMNEGVSV